MDYKVGDRIYYTGQCLDRGVVRGRIQRIDAIGDATPLLWIEIDDDPGYPVTCSAHVAPRYVFKNRVSAARTAFYDVAAAESAAAHVRDVHEQKRAHLRRLLDALAGEMNGSPSATISAAARVRR